MLHISCVTHDTAGGPPRLCRTLGRRRQRRRADAVERPTPILYAVYHAFGRVLQVLHHAGGYAAFERLTLVDMARCETFKCDIPRRQDTKAEPRLHPRVGVG